MQVPDSLCSFWRLRREDCLELSLPPLREGWLVQRHPGWRADVTGLATNTRVTGGGRVHSVLSGSYRAGILLCNPHEFLSFVLCMKWWKWSNLSLECLVWVCAFVCGLCSVSFMCVWNLCTRITAMFVRGLTGRLICSPHKWLWSDNNTNIVHKR